LGGGEGKVESQAGRDEEQVFREKSNRNQDKKGGRQRGKLSEVKTRTERGRNNRQKEKKSCNTGEETKPCLPSRGKKKTIRKKTERK